MADGVVVKSGESAEGVAYKLFLVVAEQEKKNLTGLNVNADRKWVLDAYAECLLAVIQPWKRVER